jgi:hypothetical protein
MTKLFPDYQPEQHYMRGPGPKWLAKHGPAEQVREIARQPTRSASTLLQVLARLVSRRPTRWTFRSRAR